MMMSTRYVVLHHTIFCCLDACTVVVVSTTYSATDMQQMIPVRSKPLNCVYTANLASVYLGSRQVKQKPG